MDKRYDHKKHEKEIYNMWEVGGYFTAKQDPKKTPYTIILPLPNASGKMHIGNVLMIAIEDLLIRWKRMQGYSALWIPGTDHAGFETQTTFERELKKKGKSRFDYDRKTLYSQIMKFVIKNKVLIEKQMKDMGGSFDWSRYAFPLDDRSVHTVINTFEKLEKDNMVYRANYIVNYSFKWGTTFSDAEIVYKKTKAKLYFVKYKILKRKGNDPEFITVATTRPETIFVDTHLAINPKDAHKEYLLEKQIENPLTGKPMNVIEDPFVDMEFGTGIVKITPAHDKNDFEVARRHKLEVINLITLDGKLNEKAQRFKGLDIHKARGEIAKYLRNECKIEKISDNYEHVVPVDYRSGDYVEQLVIPNWFVKVEKMKKMAYEVLEKGDLRIFPKWREVTYRRWVENMYDWAISRQIVWGIQIPAWYNVDENPKIKVKFFNSTKKLIQTNLADALKDYSLEEIEEGIQALFAPINAKYIISKKRPGKRFIQDTDVFDTWFSSGQWPLITLGYPDSEDFKYFYPTNVLETGWEIVTRWVSRMVMFGMYLTKKPPFKDVYLHGLVRAIDGRKMSKSLGNVINPDDYLDEFGVDALRMGLISGTAGGKDFNFPRDKVIAYRNFANKIWNIARFMLMMIEKEGFKENKRLEPYSDAMYKKLNGRDKAIIDKLLATIKKVNSNLEKYRFAQAGDTIYHFVWDDLASDYLEYTKGQDEKKIPLSVLMHVFSTSLKLLHPFMPFVTEAVWREIPKENTKPLIISKWPD